MTGWLEMAATAALAWFACGAVATAVVAAVDERPPRSWRDAAMLAALWPLALLGGLAGR